MPGIAPVLLLPALDLDLQLTDGLPNAGILEIEARAQIGGVEATPGRSDQQVGIDIKERRLQGHAGLHPARKRATGRDEGELVSKVAPARFGQSLDGGLAAV